MNRLDYGDEIEAMTRREPKDADQLGLSPMREGQWWAHTD